MVAQFKYVKVQKPQKAHLHPLRFVCVQYEKDMLWKKSRQTGGRPGILGDRDANTSRSNFVSRGIQHTGFNYWILIR